MVQNTFKHTQTQTQKQQIHEKGQTISSSCWITESVADWWWPWKMARRVRWRNLSTPCLSSKCPWEMHEQPKKPCFPLPLLFSSLSSPLSRWVPPPPPSLHQRAGKVDLALVKKTTLASPGGRVLTFVFRRVSHRQLIRFRPAFISFYCQHSFVERLSVKRD